MLAETEGIFTETAGGVVISALKKLTESDIIKKDQQTVALITGTGLKTIEAIRDSITMDTIAAARLADSGGWVILELDADKEEIKKSIKWAEDEGVIVTLIEGDFIEG